MIPRAGTVAWTIGAIVLALTGAWCALCWAIDTAGQHTDE